MKKNLFVIAYVAAACFFQSCISIQPVTVSGINNVQVEDVLLSPKVSFDVNLHNPNSFGLTLKEFKTSAYLDNKLMTDVSIENKIYIGGNSDVAIPLKSQPSIQDIITTYLSGNAVKGNVKLEGYVTVSKFIFRKKFPFTLNTKF
jgi:LEA14-like dessication related protein